MQPIRGEFPERPPTLAEAIYGGKDIGTKPSNNKETLQSLTSHDSKKKAAQSDAVEGKKANSVDINNQSAKPIVKQVDAHIDEPIPEDLPATIKSNFIKPIESQAIINLQMDYILYRRLLLIKSILSSRLFLSVCVGIFTIISYYKVGEYFSNKFIFGNGFWSGLYNLRDNPYFLDDLFILFFLVVLLITASFIFLKYLSDFLREESENVPNNFEKYFNCDLAEYAKIKLDENLSVRKIKNPKEKEMVNFMKDKSFVISYRETPVAFIVVKEDEQNSGELEIAAYAIRRVYIKADLFKDLISMVLKKFVLESKDTKTISIKVFNFEAKDINILKRAGFYRKSQISLGVIYDALGIYREEYSFDADAIEF